MWFDYVKSAANIADWPSRGQVAFAYEVNASRIEGDRLKFPKLGEWGSVELTLAWAGMPLESANSSGPPVKKRRIPTNSVYEFVNLRGKDVSGNTRASLHRIGSSPPPFLFLQCGFPPGQPG